jgi:hypothetical protein
VTHNNNEIRGNPKFVIATVITVVTLLGATAISTLTTAESVFAYRNNQATSQVSDCGNGFEPTNVGCQNAASQIQGDKNTVALSSQQTFPGADADPAPCIACFNPLSGEEFLSFEETIPALTEGRASTIEELCALLLTLDPPQQREILGLIPVNLEIIGVDPLFIDEIIGCLSDVFGMPI